MRMHSLPSDSGISLSGGHSPGYLGEFRRHWRPLAAACLGLIAGTSGIYLNNLFSPWLIAEFGWSRSQFSLVGLTTLISVVFLPIAGRLADQYGMRRIALAGVIGLPLVLVGLAMQTGSFTLFFVLSTAQMLIQSALAGIVVYGRLLVREFDRARGLALGVASCAPAISTALVSPFLGGFIEAYGWRAGYLLFAGCSAALGALALVMVPPLFQDRDTRTGRRTARADYGELIHSRAFLVIFGGMLLCNVHFTLQTTQLALVLGEHGISATAAAGMVSVFASGVIVGRIVCGLALDRFPARYVAFVCFLLPASGLAVLATGLGGPPLVALGVMTLGFSVGAEGDVAGYLAARYFRPELFSSVLGLFTAAIATSALVGALIVNRMLADSGSYSGFIGLASICAFVGAGLFLLLGRDRPQVQAEGYDAAPG